MPTFPARERSPQARTSVRTLGWRPLKRLAVCAGLAIGVTACGSSTSTSLSNATSATSTPAVVTTPTALKVFSPADGFHTQAVSVVLQGTATPGAGVSITGRRGKQISSAAGRWRVRLHLTVGDNPVTIKAFKAGHDNSAPTFMTLTRTMTAAEIAARRAADARRAAAVRAADAARAAAAGRKAAARKLAAQIRVQQAEADFKASVSTISYADLLKDSGPFLGKHVSFRGQILQIQQNGGAGGIMLLSVTDLGYGTWTDNVWIDYNHATTANTNDIVTVYGTVAPVKSYTTQAGGDTFVPRVRARYIDLTG